MRVMIRVRVPVDPGNDAIRSGKMGKVVQRFMEECKPEAAYFFPDGGERASLFILDLRDASQIPEIAERLFLGINARIDMIPVMTIEDLQKGLSGIAGIVERYG